MYITTSLKGGKVMSKLYLTIYSNDYKDVSINGNNIYPNLQELLKFKGEVLYLTTYELTVKRKVLQNIVYGKPLIIKEVERLEGANGSIRYNITYEELGIEDTEYSKEINEVLKSIKIKENNFKTFKEIMEGHDFNKVMLTTDLRHLELSYNKMIDYAFSEMVETISNSYKTLKVKMGTEIVDNEAHINNMARKLIQKFR